MHRTSRGLPASPPDRSTVAVGADRLTTATWGDGPPSVVMLHDGLGSIAEWRDVPARLAARTGQTVLAYDRAGHGSSTPVPTGPWPADWLHREARVLAGPAGRGRRRGPGARRPLRRRVHRRHPRRRSADVGADRAPRRPRLGGDEDVERDPADAGRARPCPGVARAVPRRAGRRLRRLVGGVDQRRVRPLGHPPAGRRGPGTGSGGAGRGRRVRIGRARHDVRPIDRGQRRLPTPARPRPQPPPRGSRRGHRASPARSSLPHLPTIIPHFLDEQTGEL